MGGHGVRNVAHRSRRERHTGGRCLSACLSASATAASCRKTVAEKAGCTAQCSHSTAKSVQAAPESSTAESRSGLLACPDDMPPIMVPGGCCSIFCCPISGAACWFSPPCRLTTEGCPTPALSLRTAVRSRLHLNEYSAKASKTFR